MEGMGLLWSPVGWVWRPAGLVVSLVARVSDRAGLFAWLAGWGGSPWVGEVRRCCSCLGGLGKRGFAAAGIRTGFAVGLIAGIGGWWCLGIECTLKVAVRKLTRAGMERYRIARIECRRMMRLAARVQMVLVSHKLAARAGLANRMTRLGLIHHIGQSGVQERPEDVGC